MFVQVSKSKVEDIQLGENLGEDAEMAPAISIQNDHEAEDLDANVNGNKAKANDNDLA